MTEDVFSMLKYRLYIDESGNSDLKHSDDPNQRFLSLTGIIVSLQHIQETMHPEMEALKSRYFGSHPDEPVTLHRKELVNRCHPFQALRDPEVESRFNQDLLACLRNWEYCVITACLDKKKHIETYQAWAKDPYYYCLALLLERFSYWLNRRSFKGDVMSESRGSKEDRRLKDEFRSLWENGTDYVIANQFQRSITSRELKVKPKSANIAGLQLADLIAHPSRSEILHEERFLENLGVFAEQIVEILADKYDRRERRIYGYGKKFL